MIRLEKMRKSPDTCLVTSLVPGNRIELQYAAVESWENYGFDIVSLNTQEEIDKLAEEFPRITIVPLFITLGATLWIM